MEAYLKAARDMKEEQKLCQFLMGLDDEYKDLWSQILMKVPSPSVRKAGAMVQQDEAKKKLQKMIRLRGSHLQCLCIVDL